MQMQHIYINGKFQQNTIAYFCSNGENYELRHLQITLTPFPQYFGSEYAQYTLIIFQFPISCNKKKCNTVFVKEYNADKYKKSTFHDSAITLFVHCNEPKNNYRFL